MISSQASSHQWRLRAGAILIAENLLSNVAIQRKRLTAIQVPRWPRFSSEQKFSIPLISECGTDRICRAKVNHRGGEESCPPHHQRRSEGNKVNPRPIWPTLVISKARIIPALWRSASFP